MSAMGKRRGGLIVGALLVPLVVAGAAVAGIAGAGSVPTGSDGAGSGAAAQAPTQLALKAAVVNNDTIVTRVIDGTEVPVPAGRLLVGQLVNGDNPLFEWEITSADAAAAGLASGDLAAVVTIPSDFSANYISSAGDTPVQAQLEIQTSGAHSYLSAVLAQTLTTTVQGTLGDELTRTYIAGLLGGLSAIGTSLTEAGNGAGVLADGIGDLSAGIAPLPGLASQLADGAGQLDSGVGMLGDGLRQLEGYSEAATLTSGAVVLEVAALEVVIAGDPDVPQYVKDALAVIGEQAVVAGLADVGTTVGIDIAAQATEAIKTGSALVAEGNRGLAAGLPLVVEGVGAAASGSRQLADGLVSAGHDVPQHSEDEAKALAMVATTPITAVTSVTPAVPSAAAAVAAVAVPVALWLGALTLSLVLPALDVRALRSRAGTGRILVRALLPWLGIAAAQAILVVAGAWLAGISPVHHLGLAGLVLVASLSFALLHQGLVGLFGRAGWIASLALLSVQVLAAGVLVPAGMTAGFMTQLGGVMPLTHAIQAAQSLIAGGAWAPVEGALGALTLAAVLGIVLTWIAAARGRTVAETELAPLAGPPPALSSAAGSPTTSDEAAEPDGAAESAGAAESDGVGAEQSVTAG